jgi:hypothetical protein
MTAVVMPAPALIDYVTYVDDELRGNAHLEIVAEASILQPSQLALFVRNGSEITRLCQLAIEQPPLRVSPAIAAVIALPDFPTAIDPTRLQRVPSDMIQFGFLPQQDATFKMSSIAYAGNLAGLPGSAAG